MTRSTALTTQAAALLPPHNGVEGGYLVLRFKSFLGTVLLDDDNAAQPAHDQFRSLGDHRSSQRDRSAANRLPSMEADLIDIQVDAAIRRKQVLFSIEELVGEPR